MPSNGEPMSVALYSKELALPAISDTSQLLSELEASVGRGMERGELPLRWAVSSSTVDSWRCETAVLSGWDGPVPAELFRFNRRPAENTSNFNCVLLVPTGIGAEIGGHAGDASPVAALLASACDTLITHPNVVNASDVIDIPPNGLYVEGSVITRLLMGTLGLQQSRNNRLLVVLGHHDDELFINAALNSVNAARSSYGLTVPGVIRLGPEFVMESSYTESGSAAGRIEGLQTLLKELDNWRGDYDAVAITSQISVPPGYHAEYFESNGEMVNPWGGVEAMLTHAVSGLFEVPSAHSPMLETQEIANSDPGIVDPRMAAEAVSLALIQCIFKGLQRSPRLMTDPEGMRQADVLTAADISCLVIPDGCLGLPTLAALEQGIAVIAVRENRNLMRNDLAALPWKPGQFYQVENYWEAAGVMSALKAGINPDSVRRPIPPLPVYPPVS